MKIPEVFVDDGIISQWEVEQGRGYGYLPAGKVIVAVERGSGEGTLCSEAMDYMGIGVTGVRLEFSRGEIVSATAETNRDYLDLLLSAGDADARRLAAFEIGMNRRLDGPIGLTFWDTKAYGSATLVAGDNSALGGDNRSSHVFAFPAVAPAVLLEGKTLLENRRFTT